MVKYCIWDVGQVIYEYSLEPLHEWLEENTNNLNEFQNKKGKFNYNPYMKGEVTFENLCEEICSFYHVKYNDKLPATFNKLFHKGIGEFFEETKKSQEFLKKNNVTNCILSNALQILKNTTKTEDLIKPEHVFTSFELGLLKPDVKIYKAVLEKLNAKPNEVIFVDDKEKNTKAAASIGIHAITFEQNTIQRKINKIISDNSSNQNKSNYIIEK